MRPAVFEQETNQAVVDQVLNRAVPEVFDSLSACLAPPGAACELAPQVLQRALFAMPSGKRPNR